MGRGRLSMPFPCLIDRCLVYVLLDLEISSNNGEDNRRSGIPAANSAPSIETRASRGGGPPTLLGCPPDSLPRAFPPTSQGQTPLSRFPRAIPPTSQGQPPLSRFREPSPLLRRGDTTTSLNVGNFDPSGCKKEGQYRSIGLLSYSFGREGIRRSPPCLGTS
jgi:hypothetical protein